MLDANLHIESTLSNIAAGRAASGITSEPMKLKKRWRGVRDGLMTALGLRKLGFFIPFKFAASVPATPAAYAELERVFAKSEAAFVETLDLIAASAPELSEQCAGPLADHWNGGSFGPLDTAAAYALTKHGQPRRIIEVGSGSSTHVLAAAGRSLAEAPVIECIDPVPRQDITALFVTWRRTVLDEGHVELFAALGPGDIAFFDSSHVLFEGTDVDIIQNRILPALAPGVMVHIHDVFLPDPYPAGWAHRAYTEQIGLGGWLCGGAYRLVFSSHHAATRMPGRVADALAGLPEHGSVGGGSLWLERL